VPLASAAAATGSDGTIYTFGGCIANPCAGPDVTAAVYAYKPGSTTSWQTSTPALPHALFGAAATTGSDGTLYVIGGAIGASPSNQVFAFKPGTSTKWQTLTATLPLATGGLAATTGSDGTLYALGGCTANPCSTSSSLSSAVYWYKPGSSTTWQTLAAALPQSLVSLAAATATDGTLYMLGGCSAVSATSCTASSAIDTYTPGTSTSWQPLGFTLPQPLGALAATADVDGTIYTVGGFDVTVSTNAVYALAFPPTVTGLSPSSGITAGGTNVTIGGTGFFAGVQTVKFGSVSVPAGNILSNRGKALTVSAPAGTLGSTVDVTVTTTQGTTPTSAADQYTYTVVNGGRYTPETPTRIMDTRSGLGGYSTPFGPATVRTLQIAGNGGVPAGASAVVLNVTVTDTTAASYLTVWPDGVTQPTASNLNWVAGLTIPNLVEVATGGDGKIALYNAYGNADVIVDVEGYVGVMGVAKPHTTSPSLAGLYTPITPVRIMDTRSGIGGYTTPFGPSQIRTLTVTGVGGVPSTGVSAVILNVTVTDTTAASYLTVWPDGVAQPVASNLNWVAGTTIPNRVMVPAGNGGAIDIYNLAGDADVIVDVNGWFTDSSGSVGSTFTGTTPTRILDTRFGTGGYSTSFGPNTTRLLTIGGVPPVPTNATAVVLNVTVTDTSAASYLTVWPGDIGSPPVVSDLNWVAGDTVPNLVVVKLGSNQAINIYNLAGTTDVIVDVVGWYS
jgi:N-acetylneuraminic acid mutarotase